MKNQSVSVFDVSDEEFAETLMGLGLKRNVAKALTYLKNVDEVTSREIEIGSDMRQPEVSVAVRELKGLKWILVREEKKPGKGRPFKLYRLEKDMNSIINQLEYEKVDESKQMLENIQRLKQINMNKS
ncbi:MAG: transcriptional regulator protein [Methanosarcinales archaeon]|nr:transcriptional regulator protein [ANME-2 cluster archaeon]MDF1532590.1 transcriptional regulator protein [ANME-2 cluster archaeon]MDW7776670.1 transcriptional regulator protein [Methanosarcinales archaeon]